MLPTPNGIGIFVTAISHVFRNGISSSNTSPNGMLYFFLKAPIVGSDLLLAYVTFLALSNQKHYYFFF